MVRQESTQNSGVAHSCYGIANNAMTILLCGEDLSMELDRIQQALHDERVDGWLFYDFRKSNPIAYQILGLPSQEMYTRRWFYFVPAQGIPVAVISAVESHVLQSLPGKRLSFRTWQEMHDHVRSLSDSGTRVAMEYSPLNAIPYISVVDAGSVDLVRSFGVDVVSSANLAQRFIAQLSDQQIASHREAGQRLIALKDLLFAELSTDLQAGRELDEYQVQQRFVELILQGGLVMPEGEAPIVAVNANSGNPHYCPSSTQSSPISRGDLVLFNFWIRLPMADAIYADYTWVAFVGTRDEIPTRQREVFEIVRNARDAAIAFVREQLSAGERVEGRQVDDLARNIMAKAGYSYFLVHRTCHRFGTLDLDNVANFNNI